MLYFKLQISDQVLAMNPIRPTRADERDLICRIINAAAEAYRGVIPDDCFHDPYMSSSEFDREIAAGVSFLGCEVDRVLVGVMGIQPVRDVDLIRHAYVLPEYQRQGIGAALLQHLRGLSTRQMLVGTWAAADWAVRFYGRHGFGETSASDKLALLKTYWTVPDRQIDTSVVLANPPLIAKIG